MLILLSFPSSVHLGSNDYVISDSESLQMLRPRPHLAHYWPQDWRQQATLHWSHGFKWSMGCRILHWIPYQLQSRHAINSGQPKAMS